MREQIVTILQNIRPEFLDFDTVEDFFEEGMLDSFDLVTLVATLDKTFNVKINGMEILPENFANVDAIVALIERYQAKR